MGSQEYFLMAYHAFRVTKVTNRVGHSEFLGGRFRGVCHAVLCCVGLTFCGLGRNFAAGWDVDAVGMRISKSCEIAVCAATTCLRIISSHKYSHTVDPKRDLSCGCPS